MTIKDRISLDAVLEYRIDILDTHRDAVTENIDKGIINKDTLQKINKVLGNILNNIINHKSQTKTISKFEAITINKIVGLTIFNIDEKALQKYEDLIIEYEDLKIQLTTPADGKNREIPDVRITAYDRKRIKSLSPNIVNNLYKEFGSVGIDFYQMIFEKTISPKNAGMINRIAGCLIFIIDARTPQEIKEGSQRPSTLSLSTPAQRQKRPLPTSSETSAASPSKKPRTDTGGQQPTIDVNARYLSQSPRYPVLIHEIPPTVPVLNKSVTTPKETTVASEEFNSLSNSNASSETNRDNSNSAPIPMSDFNDFYGLVSFETDEFK